MYYPGVGGRPAEEEKVATVQPSGEAGEEGDSGPVSHRDQHGHQGYHARNLTSGRRRGKPVQKGRAVIAKQKEKRRKAHCSTQYGNRGMKQGKYMD